MSKEDSKNMMKEIRKLRKSKRVTLSDDGLEMQVAKRTPLYYPGKAVHTERPHEADSSSSIKPRSENIPPPSNYQMTVGDNCQLIKEAPLEVVSEQPGCSVIAPTSEKDLYMNLLVTNEDSVILVDNSVIAIMKHDNMRLKVNDYVYLLKIDACLLCSCDPDKVKLAIALESMDVRQPADLASCIHIQLIQERFSISEDLVCWSERMSILQEDMEHGNALFADVEAQMLPVSSEVIGVFISGRFGTVYAKSGRLMCSCPDHRGNCVFVKHIELALKQRQDLPDFLAVFKEQLEMKDRQVRAVMQQITHSTEPLSATNLISEPCATVEAEITLSPCAKCRSSKMGRHYLEIPLYTLTDVVKSVFPFYRCEMCGEEKHCDGKDANLLHMGDYAVFHALLKDYLKLFLGEGCTLHSYYRKWYWSVAERNGPLFECTYSRFRSAWQSFVDLLETDKSLFQCSVCTTNPDVIICDGITLGFQKRYRVTPPTTLTYEDMRDGCRREDTILICNNDARKVLSDCTHAGNTLELLSEGDVPQSVINALEYLKEADTLPSHWQRLFKDISTVSPVSAYIGSPHALEMLISDQERGDIDANTMKALQVECPVLFEFLVKATSGDRLNALSIFRDIYQICMDIFSFEPHKLPAGIQAEPLSCFPSLPVICERGLYSMDKVKPTTSCKKQSKTQRTLLPGIFLIHCKHGVTYGFQVMDSGESPNIPFSVIRTRFPKAPGIIVYDNACHLQRYCLNRDPGFFKHTKFFIDKMHWWNHTGCSRGYNIRLYSNRLTSINTQVAEQRNSTLRRLKAMLSYMSQQNFIDHLLLFLWFRNLVTNRKALQDNIVLQRIAGLYTKS